MAQAHAADPAKILRITFQAAETGFDPVKVSDYYSGTVIEAIFEPLLTYDYLARPAKLVPNGRPVACDRNSGAVGEAARAGLMRASSATDRYGSYAAPMR